MPILIGNKVRLITAPFEERTVLDILIVDCEPSYQLEPNGIYYEPSMVTKDNYVVVEPTTAEIDSKVIIDNISYLASNGYIRLFSKRNAEKMALKYKGRAACV